MSTHKDYLQKLQDWMELRNYSQATVSAYRCALGQFLEWREAEGFTAPFSREEARRSAHLTPKFDKVGEKAYFTSTLFGRKAGAFPLRNRTAEQAGFVQLKSKIRRSQLSARCGSRAWLSG